MIDFEASASALALSSEFDRLVMLWDWLEI
ncbi:Uncharacterised protein [Klebsiella pneumoniae]|nr:Uncharacterised protein [Klebsiella pneumoniae]SBW74565.1 Uncharacterised protein [Klebsiella pneumoniae]SSK21904.1 Uncharacterised protein [Klebsiella pneumoniae]SVU02252.1 Uncharacterised protein [Klebsiella pneumoniae]SWP61406.1 Uncharacterised protein [Klebsiella pneumoniae]